VGKFAGKFAGKKDSDPKARVRRLMKAGKVKKKCCRSKSRCKMCPVLALMKARAAAG
jgi:hypothetical protein